VPLSKLVTDTREPLYSQPLHSLESDVIKETASGSASILLRKQPIYASPSENHEKSNQIGSQSTLDNPAVLEQQLEALAYHKLQMEKRGLLGLKVHPTEQPVTSIPKLSSTSLSGRKLTGPNASNYNNSNLNLKTSADNIKSEYVQLSTPSEKSAISLYSSIQQSQKSKS